MTGLAANSALSLTDDLLDEVSDLIGIFSSNGAFLYANRAWFRELGYQSTDLARLTLGDLVAPGQRPRIAASLERAASGTVMANVSLVVHTSGGRPFPLRGSLTLAAGAPPGTVRGVFRPDEKRNTSGAALTGTGPFSPLNSILHEALDEIGRQRDFAEQMLNTMGQGVLVIDLRGVIKYANPAYARMLGYETAEILGHSMAEYILPSDRLAHSLTDPDLQSEGIPFEARLLHRSGTVLYGLITRTAYHLSAKRVGSILVVSNLTQRKQVELALERERNFVATVLDTAASLIMVLDRSGVIVGWNRACEQLTGWSAAAAVGQPFWEVAVPPERREAYQARFMATTAATLDRRYEASYLSSTGEQRRISWATSILANTRGDPDFIVCIGDDVTDQRRAEVAQRESEERYRALAEASFEGVFLQENGVIFGVNEAGAEILGYPPAELIGLRGSDFVVATERAIIAERIRSGFDQPYETLCLRKDGTPVPVEVHGKTLSYHDRPIRVTALRDLTRQKQAERERELLVGKLKATVSRIEALYDSSRALIASTQLSDVLQAVVDGGVRALNTDRVSVILMDQQRGEVTALFRGGASANQILKVTYTELMDGLTGWVLRNLQPVLSPKGGGDSRESPLVQQRRRETKCGAIMVAPLVYHGQALGTITAIADETAPDYEPEDLELLIALAGQASAAIATAQLFDETQRLARMDSLTGLLNRRAFFDGGALALHRALAAGQPASAIMLDVDHFKRINDTYGHATGDAVLRIIAARCQAACPPGGLLARYGGEEFALLLPGYDQAKATQLAESIRHVIAAQPLDMAGANLNVTTSLGVGATADPEQSLDALLAVADAALYQAKHGGRNRVVVG